MVGVSLGGKAREVVLAHQHGGQLVQSREVGAAAEPVAIGAQVREQHRAADGVVAVDALARGAPGVELPGHAVRGQDAHVPWQVRVDRVPKPGRRDRVDIGAKARHLARGVNAGVRAAGGEHADGVTVHALEPGFQHALDGPAAALNLPALEVGAVVGEGELVARYRAGSWSTSSM